ncbi:MAG: helix-turn-helix domain-containing protein [Oscillospiraceae bacterium]|jgi:AraC-like DNA-binding protein|nr:helix-turn-helix domain-containing protein [Oscillospiraceae bacterium]
MSRFQAEKAARRMIISGYRHHSYEDERMVYESLFQVERDEFIRIINSRTAYENLFRYAEIMAPTRLRALQNGLICLLTSVSRTAINYGMDVEFSFALSDYYINQLELAQDEENIVTLTREIMLHYYDLVQNEKRQSYTKPIARAVRYIGINLYGRCPVAAVAEHVGLERHYFSSLFRQQVGVPPSCYILRRKLDEARKMLKHMNSSVTETAESLGFCDTAHFSRRFKKEYGISPSDFARRDIPRAQ